MVEVSTVLSLLKDLILLIKKKKSDEDYAASTLGAMQETLNGFNDTLLNDPTAQVHLENLHARVQDLHKSVNNWNGNLLKKTSSLLTNDTELMQRIHEAFNLLVIRNTMVQQFDATKYLKSPSAFKFWQANFGLEHSSMPAKTIANALGAQYGFQAQHELQPFVEKLLRAEDDDDNISANAFNAYVQRFGCVDGALVNGFFQGYNKFFFLEEKNVSTNAEKRALDVVTNKTSTFAIRMKTRNLLLEGRVFTGCFAIYSLNGTDMIKKYIVPWNQYNNSNDANAETNVIMRPGPPPVPKRYNSIDAYILEFYNTQISRPIDHSDSSLQPSRVELHVPHHE